MCSQAVSLFAQVYKWVPVNLMLGSDGISLVRTSIPSTGEEEVPLLASGVNSHLYVIWPNVNLGVDAFHWTKTCDVNYGKCPWANDTNFSTLENGKPSSLVRLEFFNDFKV